MLGGYQLLDFGGLELVYNHELSTARADNNLHKPSNYTNLKQVRVTGLSCPALGLFSENIFTMNIIGHDNKTYHTYTLLEGELYNITIYDNEIFVNRPG